MPSLGGVRRDLDSVKRFYEPEHAFEDLRLGEILFHFLIGERVELCAQLLGGESDIPGLKVLQPELCAGEMLELGVVLARVWEGARRKVLEKHRRGLGR